jgi:hypothetical protein
VTEACSFSTLPESTQNIRLTGEPPCAPCAKGEPLGFSLPYRIGFLGANPVEAVVMFLLVLSRDIVYTILRTSLTLHFILSPHKGGNYAMEGDVTDE